MSEKKVSAVMIISLLLAVSAVAALVVERKKVQANCSDLRVAMDGGYSAVLKTGGINPSSELTVYKLHNRKRVRLGTITGTLEQTHEGLPLFEGDGLKLTVKNQPSTGRHLASLDGEVNGEKVSATLSCVK